MGLNVVCTEQVLGALSFLRLGLRLRLRVRLLDLDEYMKLDLFGFLSVLSDWVFR